jgi:chemotaxis protein methyltransferase CheR
MVRNFTRVGVDYQVNPDIRAMVEYKLLNLATPWPPLGQFDLVFMRNVLIYFSQDTKTNIVNKAESAIRNDGYLVLGSTESLLNTPNKLERVQYGKTTCYRPQR